MEGIVHLSFLSKGASFLPICHAESMQAAVTENPNLGSVTKKHLFLAVLEAGRLRSKHRWMQRLVRPTSWSTDSCLLIVSSPARRSKGTFWGLFKKGTNPIHAGEATLVTSLPPRSPPLKTITFGGRFQHIISAWSSRPSRKMVYVGRVGMEIEIQHCSGYNDLWELPNQTELVF